jgi:sarcosine oxidase delta subunit
MPSSVSDDEWADYVFMRKNPKGLHYERWAHSHGCRRWFNVARDTATDRILAVYGAGDPPPDLTAENPSTPCGEPVVGSGNIAMSEPDKQEGGA